MFGEARIAAFGQKTQTNSGKIFQISYKILSVPVGWEAGALEAKVSTY